MQKIYISYIIDEHMKANQTDVIKNVYFSNLISQHYKICFTKQQDVYCSKKFLKF